MLGLKGPETAPMVEARDREGITALCQRAVVYFHSKGIPLREEFKNVDAKGNLIAVYLEEEIGGFAVHIVKQT